MTFDADMTTKYDKKMLDFLLRRGQGCVMIMIKGQHDLNNSLVLHSSYQMRSSS